MARLKDQRLADLASEFNVARFVSFDPDGHLRFSTGIGDPTGLSLEDVISALLARADTVNVRTFRDDDSKSTPFRYQIDNAAEAARCVREFGAAGLFTIVNETIDVKDGGVSGVSMSGVTEFGPGDTPRLVEDPSRTVARLETSMAWAMLGTVYPGVQPPALTSQHRVEFSVHPQRVGHRSEHVVIWEIGPANEADLQTRPQWPNDFSRHLGDKVFGLLVADILGFPVPRSTVIPRRLGPFSFGTSTGTGEAWIRTAPSVAEPGYFTTSSRWVDPFALLAKEDPQGLVSSVIAQEGVAAAFSGGALSRGEHDPLVEGVTHGGLDFMAGEHIVDQLPDRIIADVCEVVRRAQESLGGVQLEWVHDGDRVWVVQLHAKEIGPLGARRLSSGDAEHWLPFDPADGLETLRALIEVAVDRQMGVEVLRPVGVTSHVGDILRKARVPGRFAYSTQAGG